MGEPETSFPIHKTPPRPRNATYFYAKMAEAHEDEYGRFPFKGNHFWEKGLSYRYGSFYAPRAGLYYFTFTGVTTKRNTSIRLLGYSIPGFQGDNSHEFASAISSRENDTLALTAAIQLEVGNEVAMVLYSGGIANSSFIGFLV